MKLYILLIFLTIHNPKTDSAKILGIFWTHSKSHVILAGNLLQAMATRGHEVKVMSTFIDNVNLSNYKQEQLNMGNFEGLISLSRIPGAPILTSTLTNRNSAEAFWTNKAVQNLIKSEEKFDLALFIEFYNDGMLGLAHHVGASIIQFSPVGAHSLTHKFVGNPNFAYFPNPFFSEVSGKTFSGRLLSAFLNSALYLTELYVHYPIQQEFLMKNLPNAPPLSELLNNISLVFVNSHFSIEPPRPHVPNMVQIGGFHLSDGKKLPKDLQDYLDGAKEGVVFFSFGTNVKIGSLDKDKLEALLQSFQKVKPFKVLMKSEIDLANIPDNVLVKNWLPQNDILAHPNIKAFITHAGLGGITEALFHGVPMLALPFFGDQRINAREAVDAGHTIQVNFETMSKETFYAAFHELLHNSKYSNTAKKYSLLLRKQPIKPLDLAIWWMEHIIEHRGGEHLRNKAMDLTWYQLYMIDVLLFYLAVFSIFTIFLIYTNLYIFRKILNITQRKMKIKKN